MYGDIAVCRNCSGYFVPRKRGQAFCSAECRRGWGWRKTRVSATTGETDDSWMLWRQKGLHRNVCLNCFQMSFDETPKEFCSESCQIIYGNYRKV